LSAPGSLPAYARVLLDLPVGEVFDYRLGPDQVPRAVPGAWVVVPWGTAQRVGLVASVGPSTELAEERVREVTAVLADAPLLPAEWFAFLGFVAGYYHRTLGEVALPALPKRLRTPPAARARGSVFARLRRRPLAGEADARPAGAVGAGAHTTRPAGSPLPTLNPDQQAALAGLREATGFRVSLLHGVTGSGKTEVYLHWLAEVLATRPDAQALLLVPEIGLTPQLTGLLRARFAGVPLAVLHS
jgi:primosomal protein N' (replication factor Y)